MPFKRKVAENNSRPMSLSGSIKIMAITNGMNKPINPSMLPQKIIAGFPFH
jgi:hypothetical protein